jgi:NUMOD4 motif
MKEQWKMIENFPDYSVSNFGRVKRLVATQRRGVCYRTVVIAQAFGLLRCNIALGTR